MNWLTIIFIIIFGSFVIAGFYETIASLWKLDEKFQDVSIEVEKIREVLEEARNLLSDIAVNSSSPS